MTKEQSNEMQEEQMKWESEKDRTDVWCDVAAYEKKWKKEWFRTTFALCLALCCIPISMLIRRRILIYKPFSIRIMTPTWKLKK